MMGWIMDGMDLSPILPVIHWHSDNSRPNIDDGLDFIMCEQTFT